MLSFQYLLSEFQRGITLSLIVLKEFFVWTRYYLKIDGWINWSISHNLPSPEYHNCVYAVFQKLSGTRQWENFCFFPRGPYGECWICVCLDICFYSLGLCLWELINMSTVINAQERTLIQWRQYLERIKWELSGLSKTAKLSPK